MNLKVISLFLVSCLTAAANPRVANTTIVMPASPPVSTIELENAFPGLTFSSPVCMRSPAHETQRLFVCEKGGDLELIPDVTAATLAKTVFLDVDQVLSSRGESIRSNSEMGLLGLAFHPDYVTNGFFFTVYNVSAGGQSLQRISRWHDPNITDTVADPNSEEILIEMRNDAGNHNGGDLHFGPDGYLYASWGDEGNQNDSLNNSQFIDKDFWASITRIDVDLEPEDYTVADGTGSDDANVRPNDHAAVKLHGGNPLYEVPADNPWVGATSFNGVSVTATDVRTEIFAVGFRNPWRFSFDSGTGGLWVGDVGQGAWEEVATVEIGSNHGWAWYEGDANGPKFNSNINGASRTNATVTKPVWDYGHGNGQFQGNSVTGGFVYRGTNIPDLVGKYIFADYTSGNIWALERTSTPGEPDVERIAGEGGIVDFGPDPSNGDILMADIGNGVIRRLVSREIGAGFPQTLTATGIFSDVADLTPNPGVLPYKVNLPFWADHSIKQRWFAIKNTTDLIGYSKHGAWQYPNGMVWVKHFDLELERGNPATRKRIETRVLVRNQIGETNNTVLLTSGATASYLVPPDDSFENTWMTTGFDDTTWNTAATGLGYDENSNYGPEFGEGGDLGNALNGQNTSIYIRIPFNVADASTFTEMTLRMKYDDGFVAYLNGQQVAAANEPTNLAYDSEAEDNNPDGSATNFEDFNLNAFAPMLLDGANLLAIQGLNDGINSSDMLIVPELLGGVVSFSPGVYGVSYKWNESGTEAGLVGSGGENVDLTITTPGGSRQQTWNIPSRAACNICHTPEAGFALSFNTRQLNHDSSLNGRPGNFLILLHDCGYLDTLPESPAALPRHVTPTQTEYSLEARVRSYLDVNCAYCHQDPGIDPLSWQGNLDLTMGQTGLINGLTSGGTQHPNDRLVVPGNAARSILLSRIAVTNGYTRMPQLASNELDTMNIQLLTDWINQEASSEDGYTAWRIANFGDDTSAEGDPGADPDRDGETNEMEWLALTEPNNASDSLTLAPRYDGNDIEVDLPGLPNRGITVQHSNDLLHWLHWDVPGNDGIARNPVGSPHTLRGSSTEQPGFLRLYIEEK